MAKSGKVNGEDTASPPRYQADERPQRGASFYGIMDGFLGQGTWESKTPKYTQN